MLEKIGLLVFSVFIVLFFAKLIAMVSDYDRHND